MAGVVTLFFKEEDVDEAGNPVNSRSLPVLGIYVEGSALIAGVSPNVTAIFPLAELKSAVYVEELEGSDAGSAPDAGNGESPEPTEGGQVYVPNFGAGSTPPEGGEA